MDKCITNYVDKTLKKNLMKQQRQNGSEIQ